MIKSISARLFLGWALIAAAVAAEPAATPVGDNGRIQMSPSDDVQVGSRHTFTFTYTVGARGMKRGGSIRIATPNEDWSYPLVPLHRNFLPDQQRLGKDNGYVSYARSDVSVDLKSASNAWIDLTAETRGSILKPWLQSNRNIVGTVHDADLAPGDVMTLRYGDKSKGELGARVQRMAPTDHDHFRVFVDVDGTGGVAELQSPDLEKLHVVAGPPSQLNVVAPAIVRPGQTFAIHIAALDEFRNRPNGLYVGDLRITAKSGGLNVRAAVSLKREEENHLVIEGAQLLHEGVNRIVVEAADGSGRWESNPIWCTNRPGNLYFGDLHVHGMYHGDPLLPTAGSIGTPAELYQYGRDVSALDFMGVTDMYGYTKKEGWAETMAATRKFHQPGRFVTFKGFEYGVDIGHRNVIYRDCEDEPALAQLPVNDVKALFKYYQGRNVIMIPHHTKVWTDWKYYDPVLEPIVEAYSAWGSGVEEVDPLWDKAVKPGSGVFSALARGYHVGMIASGDSHCGMPGRSYPADRYWCVNSKSGFACVYAPELTREAVFDALRQRHCYGTTGARMILEFSVNNVDMGQEVAVATASTPRCIRVHAIGTDLASFRVIKNNRELAKRVLDGDETRAEFYDPEPAKSGDFYYVRVVQKDENTAWSSPIWVNVNAATASNP